MSTIFKPRCRLRLPPAPACVTLSAALAGLLGGCAGLSYDRLQLGQEQRAYQRAFPEDRTRRTPTGICYLEHDALGRVDAVVALLTADRRVAGKLHAVHQQRNYGFAVETTYQLRGELDQGLLKLAGSGPVDTLRAIADELTTPQGDTFVRDAHGWVAAGLVRLVQHWPHIGDEGPAVTRLTDLLDRIPAGGQARITVNPQGVCLIEYTQTSSR